MRYDNLMKLSKNRLIFIAILSVLVLLGLFAYVSSQKKSQHIDSILACYPKSPTGAEDTPIPNNSVQYVKETTRMFINMPKDLYPKDTLHSWTTVSGNATAGYISNIGFPGEAEGAAPGCWSTYMEFDGSGEVDLRATSTVTGVPDYFVRFIVSQ